MTDKLFADMMEVSPLYVLGPDHVPQRATSFEEWYRAMDGDRRIGDTVEQEWRVSTVFIGMGTPFRPDMMFETMVWLRDEYYSSRRYATWAEAKQGHEDHCTHMRIWFSSDEPSTVALADEREQQRLHLQG